jgi:hypothetical protein
MLCPFIVIIYLPLIFFRLFFEVLALLKTFMANPGQWAREL